MKNVLVQYNEARVCGIHGMFVLNPGVNSVNPEHWEKAKSDEHVQHMIENGLLVELEPDQKEKGKKPASGEKSSMPMDEKDHSEKGSDEDDDSGDSQPARAGEDLSAFGPKKAIKLVKATFDENLLKQFEQAEKRDAVLEAIMDQLEKVKVEPKKDEK